MLSKTQSKYIRSLALLKFRQEHKCFIAEGEKIAGEWLNSAEKIQLIVALESYLQLYKRQIEQHPEATIIVATEEELKSISTLQTPNQVLLVVSGKEQKEPKEINNWCIALDGIRDPGNMGTILRIADWFGIQHVVCAPDCVDAWSPKVVQAAMGAHLRVHIYEAELTDFIKNSKMPALAATLGGESVYKFDRIDKGILIIGNEAKGIHQELIDLCAHKLTIPRMGGAESLNAGVSTGILCALLLGK